jgi:signal transduction histidine kinase/ActR/RegA family two-component response regulator
VDQGVSIKEHERSRFSRLAAMVATATMAPWILGVARLPDPQACVMNRAAFNAASSAPIGLSAWERWQASWDVFTNFGHYIPRTHCLQTAEGGPDWLWIGTLLVLTSAVVAAYLRIFVFWRRCYLEEKPADRNTKLMDLAYVFLWCAICGYVMSIVMFFWPGYRLLAVFLLVLNFFSWRFASSLGDLRVSLSAKRLQRELDQHMRNRTAELEALVEDRTRELEEAKATALAASEFKSMFLANMSHEIRTPMNAILGFVDLLADHDDEREQRLSHMGTIRRNAEHLLGVINDILDLSKIEAGRLAIEPVPTAMGTLLADVRTLMAGRAEAKGLSLDMRVDPGLPDAVLTDGGRVRQVLINLIGNAVKFTQTGGIRVLVSAQPGHGAVWAFRVEVRDTGIGLTPQQVATLFQPFTQADASITRRFGGTGLGLSISRNLAQLLGGDVEASGTPGEGSCFTFTFKTSACEPAVQTPAEPAESSVNALRGLRVLLAEDGVDNQRLIRHYLTRVGVDLAIVENGRLAVDALEGDPGFDAVLMDMQMPEMDGYTAASLLRSRGCDLPIVALTAHAMAGDRERCLASGCSHYLTKPLDRALLISTLAMATGSGGGAPTERPIQAECSALPPTGP